MSYMKQDPVGEVIPVLLALLPFQLHAFGLVTLGRMTQSFGTLTHVGNLEEVSGSWIRIGSVLAIAATWIFLVPTA